MCEGKMTVAVLDEKMADLQKKYGEIVKRKQQCEQEMRKIDEEMLRMTGAYQQLNELKADLMKAEAPEPEKVVEEKKEE